MMNLHNKRSKKVIATVLIIILVIAMVVPVLVYVTG